MVVFQELLQDLINPLANVRFPFCCDQRVKGCFLGYREHRIGLSLIPVRHIFVKEQNKHIILIPRRLNAATELVAGFPEHGVEF